MLLINFLIVFISIFTLSSAIDIAPFISDSQDADIAELPFVVSNFKAFVTQYWLFDFIRSQFNYRHFIFALVPYWVSASSYQVHSFWQVEIFRISELNLVKRKSHLAILQSVVKLEFKVSHFIRNLRLTRFEMISVFWKRTL